jgi:hypothetical protein
MLEREEKQAWHISWYAGQTEKMEKAAESKA